MVASVSSADSAIQSDWSGGPGVPGPVTSWNSSFAEAFLVDGGTSPGSLLLDDLSNHLVDDSLGSPLGLLSLDIDADGCMDLLVATRTGREIIWWENCDTAPGIYWTKHYIYEYATNYINALTAGDLDGDGDVDVAACVYGLFWWENLGGGLSWTMHVLDDYADQFSSLHANDINGDGHLDVVGAAKNSDCIFWWENLGGGAGWVRHTVRAGFDDPRTVYSIDMDSDGDIDILSGSRNDNIVVWWENADGAGTAWVEHLVDEYVPAVVSVYADDVDGDGDMDVMAAAYYAKDEERTGEDLTWWENVDGTGTTWVAHVIDDNVLFSCAVHSADIDGDGDTDVMGGTGSSSQIPSWYENLGGTGLVWIKHPLPGYWAGGGSMWAGDIDSDGVKEAVGTAGGTPGVGANIVWWDVTEGYASAGSLESSILYLGNDPGWESLGWIRESPAGTSVTFQVRASDDPAQMGAWSDTLTDPCGLQGILPENASYFQYRAILQSEDPDLTPELEEVTVFWNPLGTSEPQQPTPPAYALHPVAPNPASGIVTIRFSVPEPASVELAVFDLTGRIVRLFDGECPPGVSALSIGELHAGIYFIRMRAGAFAETRRFAVVER